MMPLLVTSITNEESTTILPVPSVRTWQTHPDSWNRSSSDLIITLAARHKLPAVYPFRWWVTTGGLVSYGPDYVDQFRGAAGYVDRILKGAKPADLPVQAPTKYELVVNLKTAKALGLGVPPSIRLLVDEVIE